MRAYRETFASERGRRGLTQEELLRRMGAVESDYAERYSHATVSRWESGVTRPTVQRLLAFGKALDLSTSEVAGLILLAGLAPDFQAATDRATRGPGDVSPSEADESEEPNSVGIEPAASDGTADSPGLEQSSTIDDLGRFLILRCLPLGMLIVGGGYAFSIFAGNESWVPTVYVGLVSGLVLIQGFMWPSRRYGLRSGVLLDFYIFLVDDSVSAIRTNTIGSLQSRIGVGGTRKFMGIYAWTGEQFCYVSWGWADVSPAVEVAIFK